MGLQMWTMRQYPNLPAVVIGVGAEFVVVESDPRGGSWLEVS